MRKLLGLGSLLVVCLPLVAAAQPPPPPPPPPGGGGGTDYETPEKKMRLDVGLMAGLAQGDYENVGTSPGLTLVFGVTVANNISIFGGLRYISVQPEEDTGMSSDVYQADFLAGGRYSFPVSPTAKAFAEAMLLYSTLGDDEDSFSGIGFGARGGAVFNVSGSIGIGGAISYTTSTIDIMSIDVDAAWLGIEGFASFGF